MRRGGNKPNETQERKVLKVLQDAKGGWVSKRYFAQTMLLSQAGRALFNLQKNPKLYGYDGMIESSAKLKLRDEYKFCYYRLVSRANELIPIQGAIREKTAEVSRLF